MSEPSFEYDHILPHTQSFSPSNSLLAQDFFRGQHQDGLGQGQGSDGNANFRV